MKKINQVFQKKIIKKPLLTIKIGKVSMSLMINVIIAKILNVSPTELLSIKSEK
jgi:hypothetical protein